MSKIEPSQAAKDLRALRRRLRVPLADCAKAIGVKGASSYQHYEDKLKDPVQPLSVIRGLTPLFVRYGATIEEMASLAGVTKERLSDIVANIAPEAVQTEVGGTLSPADPPHADSGATLNRDWLRQTVIEMFRMREKGILPPLSPEAEANRLLELYDLAVERRRNSDEA